MRKITKVLLGSAAVLATAALVQVATPATADAAAIEDGKITVDAATQTVTIDKEVLGDGNNRQIYFGIPKVSVKSGKGTVTAPTKWDVYDTTTDSNNLVISLASLKNTVDNYIQIKGSDDETPVTILIPKAEKYRAEFNPVAAGTETDKFFKVTKAKKVDGAYPAFEGSKVEIRTQHGDWSEFTLGDTNPFAAYQEQGATLYVKVPATTSSVSNGVSYFKKKVKTTDSEEPVTVKQVGSFASAEFKVSIKKRPDGPKVKVDFVKSTLSVPAKCIYRVVDIDALGTGDFIGAGEADAVSATKVVKSLTDTVVGAGTTAMIEQKKAAVTTGKKAIESKVAQLMVTRPANPEITDATISESSSNSCVGGKVNGDVTISRTDDFKKLNFENTSDKVYQVYLKNGDVTETDPKAKWNDIKAKKGTTNGKYSLKLPSEAKQIWIRVKGDSKTATLSSNAFSLGKVEYDKDAADAATADNKIDEAVGKLKEAGSVAGTAKAVTVNSDKKSLKLPSAPTGVTYEWASDNDAIIDNEGKLKETIASDAISGDTATVTLTATVKATGTTTTTTTKQVKFVVTVKKTTSSEGESATSTYTIESVAQGVDA